jgi:hypothetical protein
MGMLYVPRRFVLLRCTHIGMDGNTYILEKSTEHGSDWMGVRGRVDWSIQGFFR